MNLRYKLTGTGWCQVSIEDGNTTVTVSASYLSDALGDLARGALAVHRGSDEARFSFDEEPGEYRWVLKKKDKQTYGLSIIEFAELWGNRPDEDGKVIFEQVVSRRDFAKMILKAIEDVLHVYGEEGYKKKWAEHGFPSKELAELRSCLGDNQNEA